MELSSKVLNVFFWAMIGMFVTGLISGIVLNVVLIPVNMDFKRDYYSYYTLAKTAQSPQGTADFLQRIIQNMDANGLNGSSQHAAYIFKHHGNSLASVRELLVSERQRTLQFAEALNGTSHIGLQESFKEFKLGMDIELGQIQYYWMKKNMTTAHLAHWWLFIFAVIGVCGAIMTYGTWLESTRPRTS